ncbi:hypothetical protein M569_10501 [Genlisea aurea]|uniref:Uncharacterized protein n=1 Tax=Genlisea aurea TaxID=192259 RepID=S8CBG5_9LAMI|nr:hypothetical protein M569_10501 [Genlisea aurea]
MVFAAQDRGETHSVKSHYHSSHSPAGSATQSSWERESNHPPSSSWDWRVEKASVGLSTVFGTSESSGCRIDDHPSSVNHEHRCTLPSAFMIRIRIRIRIDD